MDDWMDNLGHGLNHMPLTSLFVPPGRIRTSADSV
jgi:hypothetical protein